MLTHWGTSKLILDFSICFTFQSHVYHTIYRWNLKISSWVLSALICMAWRFVFTHRVAHFPTFVSPPPAPQQNLYSFTIKLLNLTVTSRPILYKIKSTYIQSNWSWWWNHFQRHVMISAGERDHHVFFLNKIFYSLNFFLIKRSSDILWGEDVILESCVWSSRFMFSQVDLREV